MQNRSPLKIGFDAKRLFKNFTGLGNYSRTLVKNLQDQFPEHDYFLFTPGTRLAPRTQPFFNEDKYRIVMPGNLALLWRTHRITYNPVFRDLDIYHGLSHELPFGIPGSGVFKVVTIHDLIFEYFPQDYSLLDRRIYHAKFRYACRHADAIIAISNQTREDIVKYYGISPDRIHVIYQSCDPQFYSRIPDQKVEDVKSRYQLPDDYLLYVGSVIARKNLGNIIRAMDLLPGDQSPPLVIIGSGKKYEQQVRELIRARKMEKSCHWISPDFDEFPAIYKGARMFILPSFYEGFGIPLLEAMSVGTPVITSDQSALAEIVGEAGLTVAPGQPEAISEAIERLSTDEQLHNQLKSRGKERARAFLPGQLSKQIMDVYQRSGV